MARANYMQPTGQQPTLVSIILVNYNGADLLPPCLESLRHVTYPNYEVIVVDNASQDDSLQVLAGFPWVKVVRSERNLGSSGGYNLGLVHSQGEFILMMNNDMIANPDFVRVLVHYLQQHPEVGIVQGKMVLPRRHGVLEVCGSFFTRFGLPYHYGYYKADGPLYQRSRAVFCGKGATMMFRREVIRQAGGYYFNEDFFCYYEETDLCHRAWLAGYETHFVPSPPVQHLSGATVERTQQSGFGIHYYLRNMMYSLLTTLEVPWLLRIMPLYLAIFLASMAMHALTGKWALAAAHWRALAYNLGHLRKIRAQRRRIRAIRKKSDREIFARVLRNPRWDYFWKTFTGRLSEYVDDELRETGKS